jgi:hypothetical protein
MIIGLFLLEKLSYIEKQLNLQKIQKFVNKLTKTKTELKTIPNYRN